MPHDIKDLKRIVSFCRKNGITKYKSGTFEIELDKFAPTSKKLKPEDSGNGAEEFPQWDSMTPEQKLLWSSTPVSDTSLPK